MNSFIAYLAFFEARLYGISAESESIGLGAWIEEADLKGMIRHRAGIADQLIKPLRRHDAVPFRIDIDAMGRARALAVDGHDKANRIAVGRGSEHQMQIAGVEPIDDGAVHR